jgi:hypothetical protein
MGGLEEVDAGKLKQEFEAAKQ